MATVEAAILTEIQSLLRAGKVQEADDLTTKHIAAAAAPAPGAPAAPAPPKPPRHPNTILSELLTVISNALGARSEIESLVEEFKSVL